MATMKMGMVIAEGLEKEMRKEYDTLLKKAKNGFCDKVEEKNDVWFTINLTDCKIGFNLEKYFSDKYAIYQIIE